MCDQLKLLDFVSEEEKIYQQIMPAFLPVLKHSGIPTEQLTLEKNKDYYSVLVTVGKRSALVCRIKVGTKVRYVSFRNLGQKDASLLAPFETQQTKTDKDANFIRILLPADGMYPAAPLEALMSAVMQDAIDALPKDFDCCSHYMECSDAKHCVHPDPSFAISCGYRRILNQGIIFYGKNRTEP